jgi:hypothetical protein
LEKGWTLGEGDFCIVLELVYLFARLIQKLLLSSFEIHYSILVQYVFLSYIFKIVLSAGMLCILLREFISDAPFSLSVYLLCVCELLVQNSSGYGALFK